jgi:hypothetical protein
MRLAIALAIVATVALHWIASEQHYQGCVSAAEATTPAPEAEAGQLGRYGALSRENGAAERAAAVAGCSRIP